MANNLDIESPGYEFRRSYHYMNILYHKLIALNYGQEFCPEYKCRPIHRYYFSHPIQNPNEQYFTFACLCAWLIKKKCQFNLKLDPQDYEDPEITIRAIIEALRLILADVASNNDNDFNFAPGRLLSGYGPEVVWTLNVLADAALRLCTDLMTTINEPNKQTKIEVVIDGGLQDSEQTSIDNSGLDNSGNRSIISLVNVADDQYNPASNDEFDENSLLFEEDNVTVIDDHEVYDRNDHHITTNELARVQENNQTGYTKKILIPTSNTTPEEWYLQVERVSHQLQATMDMEAKSLNMADWKTHYNQLKSIDKMLDRFVGNSKPFVEDTVSRIDKQLQIIASREKFLRTNLEATLKELTQAKRSYDDKLKRQSDLNKTLVSRTASLEDLNKNLISIKIQIEERVKYLNDPSPMTTIRKSIDQLQLEIAQFDIRIGLAMDSLFKMKVLKG